MVKLQVKLEHIQKKHQNNTTTLINENQYLKDKIQKLQLEINKKSELEERFKQDIDDLSQETENLVSEIDKWQM